MESAETWVRDRTDGAVLGPKSERVVHLLATQAEFTSFASASAVAGRAGVDAATVVRTARALGFSGWPDLRLELRNRYLSSLRANEVLNEHEGAASDPILHALRSDVDNVTLAIRTIDVAQVRAIAAAIAGARRTVVIASGSFLGPAHHLVHSAGFMGLDVEFGIRGGTTLVNTLTRLGPGDCLVAINFWRLPREIRDATEIAGVAGATTCVLTDLRRSALTELADHVVTVPCEGTSHFPSLTASMAVVHAILAEITRTLGDQARDAMRATEDLWQRMNLMCD
ncbi:MAG TPA: MurR/RpiR family transcriptional regulator [Pseudonocardia sp.]|jgi:DNA-binding MurR/RpiR family transcriptional regulator|uniref:MurR/RpiR family transcriptional regulator n=1 Tax=Pseudonocardia sp. TaxID=60912 RepID=UPI002B58C18B|nr:MurR/RpiR family transcriptional regulator [Pseudonocardia sp.]HTF55311.1 MurR/RpiR family transcriptional regulator [Pseudonocardia sp.]